MRLIADIGGTNARLALVDQDAPSMPEPQRVRVADFASFEDAAARFLAGQGLEHEAVTSCAIAAAGPMEDSRIALTNASWVVDARSVANRLGCENVHLFNDLEAVALALPLLPDSAFACLRAGSPKGCVARLALNVGTGFGAAVAVPAGEGWNTLATEPGHMRLPEPVEGAETVEDVLSGPGLARLHAADPEGARRRFSSLLGAVTRDLILATGSWGGVAFCGGVLSGWEETVDEPAFHAAFGSIAAMRERLSRVPLTRITVADPALFGLWRAPLDGWANRLA